MMNGSAIDWPNDVGGRWSFMCCSYLNCCDFTCPLVGGIFFFFFGESVLFGRSLCFEGCEVTVGRLLCIIEGGVIGRWFLCHICCLLLRIY